MGCSNSTPAAVTRSLATERRRRSLDDGDRSSQSAATTDRLAEGSSTTEGSNPLDSRMAAESPAKDRLNCLKPCDATAKHQSQQHQQARRGTDNFVVIDTSPCKGPQPSSKGPTVAAQPAEYYPSADVQLLLGDLSPKTPNGERPIFTTSVSSAAGLEERVVEPPNLATFEACCSLTSQYSDDGRSSRTNSQRRLVLTNMLTSGTEDGAGCQLNPQQPLSLGGSSSIATYSSSSTTVGTGIGRSQLGSASTLGFDMGSESSVGQDGRQSVLASANSSLNGVPGERQDGAFDASLRAQLALSTMSGNATRRSTDTGGLSDSTLASDTTSRATTSRSSNMLRHFRETRERLGLSKGPSAKAGLGCQPLASDAGSDSSSQYPVAHQPHGAAKKRSIAFLRTQLPPLLPADDAAELAHVEREHRKLTEAAPWILSDHDPRFGC